VKLRNGKTRPRDINIYRKEFIRQQARQLLSSYWRYIQQRVSRTIKAEEILPIDPRALATNILGLTFDDPEEIRSTTNDRGLRIEIAGMVERQDKRITVARRLSPEIWRFTAAHEIGHYLLHRQCSSYRDSPATDAEIRNERRSPFEKEADRFAAELLMPTRLLRQLFSRMFGDPINCALMDEDQAFYLTEGKTNAWQIRELAPLDGAELVAECRPMISTDGRSLVEIFGVSSTAMAIQLLDVGLVSCAADS
jgi:hypothetical protein